MLLPDSNRPIIVTWGVVRRHTAVGSLKVYSDPDRHMEESTVMIFTFPGHNLAFSFQRMPSKFSSVQLKPPPLSLSSIEGAYLSNETSIVFSGLKHAVQVYSIVAERELLEKLQDERNDLISELAYKDEINFAYHSGMCIYM
jgi:hypothetical protein